MIGILTKVTLEKRGHFHVWETIDKQSLVLLRHLS